MQLNLKTSKHAGKEGISLSDWTNLTVLAKWAFCEWVWILYQLDRVAKRQCLVQIINVQTFNDNQSLCWDSLVGIGSMTPIRSTQFRAGGTHKQAGSGLSTVSWDKCLHNKPEKKMNESWISSKSKVTVVQLLMATRRGMWQEFLLSC